MGISMDTMVSTILASSFNIGSYEYSDVMEEITRKTANKEKTSDSRENYMDMMEDDTEMILDSEDYYEHKNQKKNQKSKKKILLDMFDAFIDENLDGIDNQILESDVHNEITEHDSKHDTKIDIEQKKESASKKNRAKKKKINQSTKDDTDEWAALLAPKPVKKEQQQTAPIDSKNNIPQDVTSSSKKKRLKKKKLTEETVATDNNKPDIINITNIEDNENVTSQASTTVSSGKKKKKQANEGQQPNLQSTTTNKTSVPKKKNHALLAKMKETLERQRLEEERKQKEEEAIKKALEEAEALEKEKERIAAELKEKRKQEKKERLLKMKEEGKPITKAQKENQARLDMLFESLKIQGVDVPNRTVETSVKKPVVYGKKKKKQHKATVPSPVCDINGTSSALKESAHTTDNILISDDGRINNSKHMQKQLVDFKNTLDIIPGNDSESESVPDDWEAIADAKGNDIDNTDNKVVDKDEPTIPSLKSSIAINEVENKVEPKKKTLRSPVVCVLGHVDTGKTKILDKLRLTNVQAGEAGGITQQIGVTNVGRHNILENIKKLFYMNDFRFLIPGFLIIDTPGHESFRNLRSRGSSLCDIAILVVDIMHGIEQQTLESFQLLIKKKSPFIIALNKIDRLYGWKSFNNLSIYEALQQQDKYTINEFHDRFNMVIAQFAEQGVNVTLFNNVKDHHNQIGVVPTSAHTGDGISDLMASVCKYSQSHLLKRLTRDDTLLQSVILEVKSVVGLGIVLDVILINGSLSEGDTIVLSGVDGPIVTQIKAIFTAQPMTDLRVSKSNFCKHHTVNESQGIRISAAGDLDKAIAGTPVLLVSESKPLDVCIEEAIHNVQSVLNTIQTEEVGVYVQASTLGSLEALLDFLKSSKINVSGVNIGPVHKKDVLKASVMHQKDPMYAVILAFDVKVETEAIIYSKKENVRIFTADIIYHLFDAFTQYTLECKEARKEKYRSDAVFPCKLRIMPQYIFNARDPIVLGVAVEAGNLRIGTPICVPSRDFINLGTVTSIEVNHKPVDRALKGQEVAIKIEPLSGDSPKMYDRHFDHSDMLVSKITRDSIDILKEYFRDEMIKSDWQLIVELKKTFSII